MWSRLRSWHKAALIVAVLAVLGLGGFAASAALGGDDPATVVGRVEQPAPAPSSAPATPSTPVPTAGKQKRLVTETEPIKFKTRTIKDNWLPKGTREMRTGGVNGVRTRTYEVTFVDGREVSRKLVKNEVTRKPVAEVVAVGTY